MYALSLFFCSNHFAFSVHLRTFIPIKSVQSYSFWEEGWLKRVDNQYFNIPETQDVPRWHAIFSQRVQFEPIEEKNEDRPFYSKVKHSLFRFKSNGYRRILRTLLRL